MPTVEIVPDQDHQPISFRAASYKEFDLSRAAQNHGSGGDTATLKKIMGHTSITTTEKYLHPDGRDPRKIMNRRNAKKGLYLVKGA